MDHNIASDMNNEENVNDIRWQRRYFSVKFINSGAKDRFMRNLIDRVIP